MKTVPVTMSLDIALVTRLRARARSEGLSLSALVNRELLRCEATAYFAVSERIHNRESGGIDALADELAAEAA